MTSSSEDRWALAVRVLALIAALAVMVAALEARTVRRARAELQQLRTERDEAKNNIASAWATQSLDDVTRALGSLDDLYRDPSEGLARSQGLCQGGDVDRSAIVTYVFGAFLHARASGKSFDASIAAMRGAVQGSEPYRQLHPDWPGSRKDAGSR